ncbi:MAG TPA: hypothetical protein ENH19_02935 [Actinobacteria bacterium]|nr:hypothetical protein [Actinomycetes bacterium]HEX21591.1 hypothetical protein [Actinomycetota bacterium]
MATTVVAAVDRVDEFSFSTNVSRIIILGMTLLIPLAINPWGFQPYSLIKVTIFFGLLLIGVFFWLLGASIHGALRVRLSRLHLFIFIYLLAAAASTIFSVSRTTAIFGWFMRYDGLLALLSYALLFTLIYQLFSNQKRALDYLSILLLASIIVCVYAVFEFFGYSLFPELALDGSRLAALWGNPGFLGGFLTLTIPVSLALIINKNYRSSEAILATVNLILALPVLYLSHTKSAWIGVGLGIFILLVVYRHRLNLRILIIGFIALLLFLSVVLVGSASTNQDVDLRSASINKINMNESARLLYWRVALVSLAKRPIFGYGPDTFNYAYRLNRPADWKVRDTEGRPVDKAHNEFLQTASNMGILGLAAYLALLIALVGGLIKGARAAGGEKEAVLWGLTASIIAYLIFIQAYFSTVELSPFFWSLAAIGMALCEKNYRSISIRFPKVIFRVSAALLLLATVSTGIFFIARVQLADYHFNEGFIAADSATWNKVVKENKLAVAFNPYEMRYQLYLGLSQLKYAAKHKTVSDFQAAAITYKRLTKAEPDYVDAHAGLGDVYLTENQLLNRPTLPAALASFEQADRLVKYSSTVKSKIAKTQALMGRKTAGYVSDKAVRKN